jgi:twinkle protein
MDGKIKSIRQALAGGYRLPDEDALRQFEANLVVGTPGWEYLLLRKITPESSRHFRLGYDTGKNAVCIPVFKDGKLVNIRYRHLDPNAPQRYTQEKGCEVWLYNEAGLQEEKSKKGVLIVEGEFDLISAWQAGFKNVISPSSGKDSYGPWIELLDNTGRVYIAYDNDDAGRGASLKLAERVGIDKSYEVSYPDGCKDANDYFGSFGDDASFRQLIKEAKPYYKHKFSNLGDVIEGYLNKGEDRIELDSVPYVKFKPDWLAVFSGDSGVGKTSYLLNVANELVTKGYPTLVLPFERGITEVGPRFIQVRYKKEEDDLGVMTKEGWDAIRNDAVDLPLYFAMPDEQEFEDTLVRAKRLFGIQFVILDHLDYFIHGTDQTARQADWIRKLKDIAQRHQIIMLVVHHIGKPEKGKIKRRPTKEDMKGSSAIYQVAEAVVLLHAVDDKRMEIIIDKNKGPQGLRVVRVNHATGVFGTNEALYTEEELRALQEDEDDY